MRAIASVITIAAAIAVLAYLQWTTPTYALLTGALETKGHQSETVSSETFNVTVKRILTTKTLDFNRFGRQVERRSEGTFVIVTAEMQSNWETMHVGSASIRGASGRSYAQSTRVTGIKSLLTSKDLQPGLPAKGLFVFEMPEQEVRDMVLVLSRQLGPRLDTEIHVQLDANGIEKRERLEVGDDGVQT